MALSGSVTTSSAEGRSVTLNWSASQSIENNASTVSWNLVGSGSKSGWVIVSEIRIKINGSEVYYRNSSNHTECWIGTQLCSGSVVIPHNSDGSKSFVVSVEAGIYQWTINCSGSSTFTLNVIPRASKPTLNVSSADFGSSVTINTNRKSTNFTHHLYYSINGGSEVGIAPDITDSYNWTIPNDLMNQIPNSTSAIIMFRLYTFDGGTNIGNNTVQLNATVPSNAVPSITSIVLSDPLGYASTFGGYVQNKSKVKVQVSASGSYGSTIEKTSITCNGVTVLQNPFESNIITEAGGTKTVSVTVTDSRGRTKTQQSTYEVIDYASPTIEKSDVYRNDQGVLEIDFKGIVTALNNLNSKMFKVSYKKQSSSSWTTYDTITNVYSIDKSYALENTENYSYDVKFTITDSFGTVEKIVQVGTAFTLMDFNSSGKGVAFGKVSENDELECDMDAKFTKEFSADLSTMLVVQRFDGTRQNVAGNTVCDCRIDISKEGYTPIGIVGTHSSNGALMLVVSHLTSSTEAQVTVRNITSSSVVYAPIIFVLYMKNI